MHHTRKRVMILQYYNFFIVTEVFILNILFYLHHLTKVQQQVMPLTHLLYYKTILRV